jgi:Spy/CpxP family protein refolding chaperone
VDKKLLVIILIISVAINLATMFTLGYFWWTQHNNRLRSGNRPPMIHGWQDTRIAKELRLSAGQIEEMRKANEAMRAETQTLREELFKKRQDLMSIVREKEPDRNRAEALIGEIAALQARHDEQIFDRMLTMKNILTSEQQQRLDVLLHTLLETGRPPELPPVPGGPHEPFELPRGEEGH